MTFRFLYILLFFFTITIFFSFYLAGSITDPSLLVFVPTSKMKCPLVAELIMIYEIHPMEKKSTIARLHFHFGQCCSRSHRMYTFPCNSMYREKQQGFSVTC